MNCRQMNGSQARAGNSVQDQARRCGAGSHGHSSVVGTNPAESCRSYKNCRSPCTWCYLNSVRAPQRSYYKEYLGAVWEHGRNCSSVPRASAMQPPRAALALMPRESAVARRLLMGLVPHPSARLRAQEWQGPKSQLTNSTSVPRFCLFLRNGAVQHAMGRRTGIVFGFVFLKGKKIYWYRIWV